MSAFGALQASFSAVTPPGTVETGTVIDLGVARDGFMLYIVDAGSGDNAYAGFDGSLDESVWYPLGPGAGDLSLISGGQSVIWVSSTPARYVRANAKTSSGTPIITASVAAPAC